jgi:hypothetical protein
MNASMIPNLDCMSDGDLKVWRDSYVKGEGPDDADMGYACRYVNVILDSRRHRLAGEIERACVLERQAERLYLKINVARRW